MLLYVEHETARRKNFFGEFFRFLVKSNFNRKIKLKPTFFRRFSRRLHFEWISSPLRSSEESEIKTVLTVGLTCLIRKKSINHRRPKI